MFGNPMKHTRLSSMEELLKFSYSTDRHSKYPFQVTACNGNIAFSDVNCNIWATPYRPEVFDILNGNGYCIDKCKETLSVPSFRAGNCALTYANSFKIATEKGLKPVCIDQSKYMFKIMEISCYYKDMETHASYLPLVSCFHHNSSENNIGTYIVINPKSLVICDEYGRTWLLKIKTSINE